MGAELWLWNERNAHAPVLTLGGSSIWHVKDWDFETHQQWVDVSTAARPGQFIPGRQDRRLTLDLFATGRAMAVSHQRQQHEVELREFIDGQVSAVVVHDRRMKQLIAFDGLVQVHNELNRELHMDEYTFTVAYHVQEHTNVADIQRWRPQAVHYGPPWKTYTAEASAEERAALDPLPDTRKPPRRVVRRDR